MLSTPIIRWPLIAALGYLFVTTFLLKQLPKVQKITLNGNSWQAEQFEWRRFQQKKLIHSFSAKKVYNATNDWQAVHGTIYSYTKSPWHLFSEHWQTVNGIDPKKMLIHVQDNVHCFYEQDSESWQFKTMEAWLKTSDNTIWGQQLINIFSKTQRFQAQRWSGNFKTGNWHFDGPVHLQAQS